MLSWDFPFPSRLRPSASQIPSDAEFVDPFVLCGESIYSLMLSTNIFANLIALGAFLVQLYLFAGLGSLNWLQFLTFPSGSPLENGPAIFTVNTIVPQCSKTNETAVLQCVEKTEEVHVEAVAVGVFILLLNLLPGVLRGLQLIIFCTHPRCRCRCRCCVAGLLHLSVGVIAVIGGFFWARDNSNINIEFVLNVVVIAFVEQVDEQVYSIVTLWSPT
jgi:hypothetical protein